jgi:casein kinase II subunit alpha
MNDIDTRQYLFLLLRALDQVHSKSIIHRDIKPQNIAYDPVKKSLKLLDFGLSEVFGPAELSTRVASQFFKAPELLLEFPKYDFSIDIWAVGCIFASIVTCSVIQLDIPQVAFLPRPACPRSDR